ncbi:MAG: glucokinase, partial [Moorea sp. SIO2B7]|nr:glucokinase [Moorena sp. SIO2B7]
MTLLLAGDIGGTKTILRLVKMTEGEKSFETLSEAIYASRNFSDLVPMVKQFLSAVGNNLPEKACLAIAGPVI